MNLIVTRHAGLVAWLANRGIVGEVIAHATAENVAGRAVIGALPLHLAALAESVTTVDMPGLTAEQRGADLCPAEMDAAGASLSTFQITKIVPRRRAPPLATEWFMTQLSETETDDHAGGVTVSRYPNGFGTVTVEAQP